MTMKILKDGEGFSEKHFDRGFGFSGSAGDVSVHAHGRSARRSQDAARDSHLSQRGGKPKGYAEGGRVEHASPNPPNEMVTGGHHATPPDGHSKFAEGGSMHMGHHVHPHGHEVVRVEHHHDGAVVHHHAHGGYTMHHRDGHMTHHGRDGAPVHHEADGGSFMPEPDTEDGGAREPTEQPGMPAWGEGHEGHTMAHPHGHHVVEVEHVGDGEIHHHAHGGYTHHHGDGSVTHHDMQGMIARGIHEHENHEHHGEHTDIKVARGGMPVPHVRLPRAMKASELRPHSPIGMPRGNVNNPPRNPMHTPSMRNTMEGGQMGMGVEPSAEPDMAGSDQGIPQLKRGGGAHGMKKHKK